ncbi:MAG: PTS mannitol transporter subunit IIABC [Chloroflexi bacterium]|nr:PTS mannitol transporter subunit IIABC [Chloroflexota bacterium]
MSRYLFVTGKLAAQALTGALAKMMPDFDYEVAVLPISVAALMDTRFVAKKLEGARGSDVVMIPGLCRGDLAPIADRVGVQVIRGPKDLKDIPAFFGREHRLEGYGDYRVKILAEVVDAYQLSLPLLLARAEYFRASGADIIDLGCPVEGNFPGVEAVVTALKERGFVVSLDTFNAEDILRADRAGLDYLLSINSRNLELAPRLACKVVVIPDFDQGLESLERNIAQLEAWHVRYIIDPILNPISFGFTESLCRFYETRRRHPQAEMLMGLGNLTELTDADSTGITAVMAGVMTELEINYVLTTEVISWARGAVRELDLARRLMYYACQNRVLPKHLDDSLLTVKDPPYEPYTEEELRAMQAQVRDRNLRIFTDDDNIYVFNNKLFIKSTDIGAIYTQLGVEGASHAFYLGRELQKAVLAVQLGKKYVQEEDLRWGYLSGDSQKRSD